LATYPFFHIDAFTETAPGGNACAVVLDADPLDALTMQAIARDMNLSETAFVLRSEVADFGARYFTPTSEIPLAGHPTIATTWALLEAERVALPPTGGVVRLELPVGPIRVDVERAPGRSMRMVMTQPRPEFLAELDPARVLPIFGLAAGDLHEGLPVQIVSTGTPQLLVPLRERDRLRDVAVDGRAFAALIEEADFFSAHLFALEGATSAGATFARHFLSPPAVIEDPFTGSATGAMGAYCWRHGLVGAPHFTAEQGHWLGRPGSASVEVVGPRDAIEAVRVGGGAATLVRGELTL
jgi:trans-2,3-dihydro-3-hydroxyanthranilate isomerase